MSLRLCRHVACLYGLVAQRPDINILGKLDPAQVGLLLLLLLLLVVVVRDGGKP